MKLPIYGTPITPAHLLDELAGRSFCVSYYTQRPSEVERIIELVGEMLMLDNGAFSAWKAGGQEPFQNPSYVHEFEKWALDILEACPAAVAVVPDTITGTTEQNRELVKTSNLPPSRSMIVFHMHESDEYLRELVTGPHRYVAIGSSGEFAQPGTPEWHARMREIMAIIDHATEGRVRPHIHMMRAQAQHHRYAWDSSDSTNLAVNHCRYKHEGPGYVRRFADRILAKVNGGRMPLQTQEA